MQFIPLPPPDETMSVEVAEMSMPAADDAHEFVVAPELAEVAECLAVPLRTGDPRPVRSHRARHRQRRGHGMGQIHHDL
jgi:hypothetical protein